MGSYFRIITFFISIILHVCAGNNFNKVYSQNLFCSDSSSNKKANKIFREATVDSIKNPNTTQSLLKKATGLDTTFTRAWLTLGIIYYEKAIQSQYDVLMNPHASFYFKKAEDCFLQVTNLCEEFDDYIANFYLGEIYFLLKEFSLSVFYLEKFSLNASYNHAAQKQAHEYLDKLKCWKKWQEHPWEIEFFPISGISSPSDELFPLVTYTAQKIYFTRQQTRQQKNSIYMEHVSEFYAAEINGIDTLGNPIFSNTSLFEIPGYQGTKQHEICFSPDFRDFYFTFYEKIKKDNKYIEKCSIWASSFKNENWEIPTPLNQTINQSESSNGYPFLSFDGTSLYFSSNRPGTHGGYDIYKSQKQANGNWDTPQNLGPKINTINNETHPFLSIDNKNLYFSSDGHFGLGGLDIFMSTLNEKGAWTIPENLGKPINTNSDDIGFHCDARGCTGYITSNRKRGMGGWDIFSFELPNQFRPTEHIIVNGKFNFEKESEQTDVHFALKDIVTSTKFKTIYNPEEQVFSAILPKDIKTCILAIDEPLFGFSTKIQSINTKVSFAFIPVVLKKQTPGSINQLDGFELRENNQISELSMLLLYEFINYLKKYSELNIKFFLNRSESISDEGYEKAQQFLKSLLNDHGIASSRFTFESKLSLSNSINFCTLEYEILYP